MEQKNIRNFCIIAHIDHGKSTLADRLLELTQTVDQRKMKEQILDQMELERERGITIKLQPVRMSYQGYELNLIDTPGHVDFTYEVSRSLAACEGAILVVDATQGIQAQTLANVNLALEHKLKLIPVVNKIDLPNAQSLEVALTMKQMFEFSDEEILFVSAKTGENVPELLEAIIRKVPPPGGDQAAPLQALIFDSSYDQHRGVVANVRIINGELKTNKEIMMMADSMSAQSLEVGHFAPQREKDEVLTTGEVGYVITGLREVEKARVGDTITLAEAPAAKSVPGYKEIKPVVYASLFPQSGDDYPALREAMQKLKLNDAALSFEPENVPSIGHGFRVGFLGLLHMEIVQERIKREFELDLVITSPSVSYQVLSEGGTQKFIYSPAELPDMSILKEIREPWVRLDIITPERYIGAIMTLITDRRGEFMSSDYLMEERLNLQFEVPLQNIISDFYDKLKSVSQGYASMNYELLDYRPADMVKLDFLVAEELVPALAMILHKSVVLAEGRAVVKKLKELIPKQQFAVAIQAAIGGKIIARETISAMRKDVTAKLYGGDVTRKQKLLKKQKAGKKRLKKSGKVPIPQQAFLDVMKR